jgi:hypothetical protein
MDVGLHTTEMGPHRQTTLAFDTGPEKLGLVGFKCRVVPLTLG